MDRIEEIHRRLPNCHLVMHGSSSVPQDLQDIINKYGGKLKQTWGVPVEEIQRGIKHGVRKINVDTDNRLAITGAIRKVFAEIAGEVRPARLPEAGPRRDEEGLRRPHDRLRPGRLGVEDQAGLHRQVRAATTRWCTRFCLRLAKYILAGELIGDRFPCSFKGVLSTANRLACTQLWGRNPHDRLKLAEPVDRRGV